MSGSMSPKMSGSMSPRMSGSMSPRMSGSMSPRMSGSMSGSMSPRMSGSMSGSMSPRMSGSMSPRNSGLLSMERMKPVYSPKNMNLSNSGSQSSKMLPNLVASMTGNLVQASPLIMLKNKEIKLKAVFPHGVFMKSNEKILTFPVNFKISDLNKAVSLIVEKNTGMHENFHVESENGSPLSKEYQNSLVFDNFKNMQTVHFYKNESRSQSKSPSRGSRSPSRGSRSPSRGKSSKSVQW